MSITTAVLITVIDVGIEKPIGDGQISVAQQLSFTNAFLAVCNIAIAFCKGTPSPTLLWPLPA